MLIGLTISLLRLTKGKDKIIMKSVLMLININQYFCFIVSKYAYYELLMGFKLGKGIFFY